MLLGSSVSAAAADDDEDDDCWRKGGAVSKYFKYKVSCHGFFFLPPLGSPNSCKGHQLTDAYISCGGV